MSAEGVTIWLIPSFLKLTLGIRLAIIKIITCTLILTNPATPIPHPFTFLVPPNQIVKDLLDLMPVSKISCIPNWIFHCCSSTTRSVPKFTSIKIAEKRSWSEWSMDISMHQRQHSLSSIKHPKKTQHRSAPKHKQENQFTAVSREEETPHLSLQKWDLPKRRQLYSI